MDWIVNKISRFNEDDARMSLGSAVLLTVFLLLFFGALVMDIVGFAPVQ